MEKEFVPYELAVKLKELGFDEPCLANYVSGTYGFEKVVNTLEIWNDEDVEILHSKIKAPLWQQAFDWFRKNNMIGIVNIMSSELNDNKFDMYVCTNYTDWDSDDYMNYSDGVLYNTYEEARQACLEKLIEICEKN